MAENDAADNPQGPAEDAGAGTTVTTAAPTTPVIDINAVLAENKRMSDERARLLEASQEVRRQRDRFATEAKTLQRRLEESGSVGYDAPAGNGGTSVDTEVLADIAEVKFKLNHPDWNKAVDKQSGKTVWDEMNAILFDDARAMEHAGRTPYQTLKNIYREVHYQRLLAAQKEAARPVGIRAQIAAAQAEMSGQGASTPIPTIDISDPNMTDAQLLEAADKAGFLDGLVDPMDPPSWMRK